LIQKAFRLCKQMIPSRYAHLFLGLIILFGISSIITYTTPFDKITESLKRYCYADYQIRLNLFPQNMRELKYYREKYRERLDNLSNGMFHDDKKNEAQAYFMNKGFLYDIWQEDENRSYLLAKIVERGVHQGELPDEVRFDYLILGGKKVVPFSEYLEGLGEQPFVSAGGKAIYLHRDSLESILRWYFESLWITQPTESYHFYDDPYSYSLYRDLQGICEDIFIKHHYMDKRRAQQTFVEEGFNVFLPTLLSMGARMEAERNNNFPSDYQYLRACLSGLSLNPNHTMFCILKTEKGYTFSPMAEKGWEAFSQNLDLTYPDQITLEQISEVSQEIFESLENSPD
jgi:hypothetical protein